MILFVLVGYTSQPKSVDLSVIRFLIAIPLLALLGYALYVLYRQAPRILIDEETITYSSLQGTLVYPIKDIKKIKYTGVSIDKFIVKHYEEAAIITYKDGRVSYIRDDYYRNTAELKQYLQVLRGERIHECSTRSNEPDTSKVKNYKGSLFLSFRFVLSLLPLYGAVHVYIDNREKGDIVLYTFSAILFVVFLLFSIVYYYVGVSDKYLVVKNHLMFWVRKRFLLDDVKEVVMEYFMSPRGSQVPRAIRIITKDFKYRRYNAATLSDKQWRQLQSALQAKGIHFRHQARTS